MQSQTGKFSLAQVDLKLLISLREEEEEKKWLQRQAHSPGDYNGSFFEELKWTMSQLPGIKPKDEKAEVPKLLEKLTHVLASSTKMRPQDWQYLQKECAPLIDRCTTAFDTRQTNHTWWQQVVRFFYQLSCLLTPKQMWSFFSQQWINRMVRSLRDVSKATGQPQPKLIREIGTITLNTLANLVLSNPRVAHEVQSAKIGKVLLQLFPIAEVDPKFSEALGEFLACYMTGIIQVDMSVEADTFSTIAKCFRLEHRRHQFCLEHLMPAISTICSKSGDHQKVHNELLQSLLDTFGRFKEFLGPEMKEITKVLLARFTDGLYYLTKHFVSNKNLIQLLQHPDWEQINAWMVKLALDDKVQLTAEWIRSNLVDIWITVLKSDTLKKKIQVPFAVLDLAHLHQLKAAQDEANQTFLEAYFDSAPPLEISMYISHIAKALKDFVEKIIDCCKSGQILTTQDITANCKQIDAAESVIERFKKLCPLMLEEFKKSNPEEFA